MHKLFVFLGGLIALFSSLFVIVALSDLADPAQSDTEPGVLWGLLIFFLLTGLAGVYLAVSNIRKKRRKSGERMERELLKLVAAANGRITPAEIAVNSGLTLKEAEEHLSHMCRGGNGELQLTKDGKMVYVFFGFLSPEEKASAQNVMDM
ncbi:MAG: hypothetical protein GY862_29905 [Gammaproteobacteria bacterium]|nr:hypothetical protein [Gammaproteobacteria bacterium]